jgi:hypothetical protein
VNQSKYSDNSLSLCLDNYWLLFEGTLPGDSGGGSMSRSPHEAAAVIKADIDSALNTLTDDARWNDVLQALNAYHSQGIDPKLVFYDNSQYYHRLGKYQKAIVIYHFKVYLNKNDDYLDDNEFISARRARIAMLRYLNSRITLKEWRLVSQLVDALQVGSLATEIA